MKLTPVLKLVGLASLVVLATWVLRWGWPDTLEAELASWGLYLLVGAAWLRGDLALDLVKSSGKASERVAHYMLDQREKQEERHAQRTQALVSRLGAAEREKRQQAAIIEQQRKDLARLLVTPVEVLEALESRRVPHCTALVTAWQHSDEELRKVITQTPTYKGAEAELLARKLNIYRGNQ